MIGFSHDRNEDAMNLLGPERISYPCGVTVSHRSVGPLGRPRAAKWVAIAPADSDSPRMRIGTDTGQKVDLFNPRSDVWEDHFVMEVFTIITSLTKSFG